MTENKNIKPPLESNLCVRPLVSVIMNCLNCEKYLKEAIDSVYAQTYPNWEIIFWDNASKDKSCEIAKSYDDKLKYFRGDKTIPLGAARNKAIEQAKGEFIAFLDCDDLWLPSKLEKQIPLFLDDQKVGLVYSDCYFFNNAGVTKRLYSKKRPYRGYRFAELLTDYQIALLTAIVRKSSLDSLPYWFDENYNVIEEYDLFVRIGLDWKIDFAPDILAKRRIHGECLTWQEPDTFCYEYPIMHRKLMKNRKIRNAYWLALQIKKQQIEFSQAIMYWKNGDPKTARKIIHKFSKRNLKTCILWFATYLPYKPMELIRQFLYGTVTPSKS